MQPESKRLAAVTWTGAVVDDAPDNLRLLAQLLEDEDYEVRIAPSGRFALESVRTAPPDLILLDIQMPDVGGFDSALEREWSRARREQSPLSYAIIDVDHFKQLNDRFGHAAGDRALRQLAKTLASCKKRPSDMVA